MISPVNVTKCIDELRQANAEIVGLLHSILRELEALNAHNSDRS